MLKPSIVNIIGKTPFGDLFLQGAPHTNLLHDRLTLYFERTLNAECALNSVASLQKIFNASACKIPELDVYEFEANQRIYEVAVVLALSRTINLLCSKSLIPAWQRPGQGIVMKDFTTKESWDGFMYEDPGSSLAPVVPVWVEIKSTMIDPNNSGIEGPDQLLKDGLPQYKKHFQSEGSACVVFVMPYTSRPGLIVDLKKATIGMNEAVVRGATGALCFLSFPKDQNGHRLITMQCHLVSENPTFAENGNIEHGDIAEMTFGKINK